MTSYSLPAAFPDDQTVASFSKRISELTTRTRIPGRGWVGSPEVAVWNARNPGPCDRCISSRTSAACTVSEDQPGCVQCRKAKTACDRKIRFLFESTRDEFFPTRGQFLQIYNMRDRSRCRTFNKTANKRRRADILFVTGYHHEEGTSTALRDAKQEIEKLRAQLHMLRGERPEV
ncbi:hypothetical protein B0H16DRAFT_1603985, partial [Mycena metata]